MVSAHDPGNGPGTSGPGNSRPSLTRSRKPAGTVADQQVSRLVTPDTTEKPGRSEYQDNQPGISDKSYRAKRRTLLDGLIAGYLGPHARWWRLGNDMVTPMSVTIAEATRDLQREIVVYWVDGGLPENFSLPGLDPVPIVFSTRFIEIQATLLRLIRAKQFSPGILSVVAESISLQVAAALVLEGGDPATACYLMMRSQLVAEGVWIVPSTIDALEGEDKDESYMAIWFYALLHEIGHVFAAEQQGDVVGGYALAEDIQEALDEVSFPAELVEQLTRRLEARRLRHSLHPDQLATEITADFFAIYALWRATVTVMKQDGRGAGFSLGNLAISVYEIYNVLIMLNNCALTARQAASLADLRDEPWVNVSYRVRLKYVMQYLATLLAGGEEADSVSEWYSRLADITAQYADSLDVIESGQSRAMRQILYPAERDEDLAIRFEASAPAPFIGLREFIAAADALGVAHPDVEYLRRRLEGASKEEHGYAFTTLWLALPDKTRIPFALPTKHGNLIFVFATQDDRYTYFRDESMAILTGQARLEEVAILANHSWQVAIICTQAAPASTQRQTHVLIEGSPLFDRMMRELADGTIWPGPDPS